MPCGPTTRSGCRSWAVATTVGGFDQPSPSPSARKHYLTGNCVVAASGNVDHEELVALTERLLGGLSAGPRSVRPVADATGAGQLAVLEKETEQAHICYGVATMNAHHPDRFALAILDGVLGGGMSSRLFQEIREKRGLAYAVYSFSALYQDTGEFAIYAGTRPDNAEEVIQLIRIEAERIAESGVKPEELDRVRQAAKGHLVLGMESTRNRMTRLGKNEVTGGEILSADEIMERFDAVTYGRLAPGERRRALRREGARSDRTVQARAPRAARPLAHYAFGGCR